MRQIQGYSLWLGHAGEARDPQTILDQGIEAVVDLASNERLAILPREIVHCRFPLLDGAGNPPWLLSAAISTVTHLISSNVLTFVFCAAGMSRSPCITAAAIARIRGFSANDALELVTHSGPRDVSPGLWHEVQTVL